MNPILECQGLSKKYKKDTCALSNLNLILERGQIIGLLGPNGNGKTTLIKLLNGILTPTEGKGFIAGFEPGIDSKKIVSYLPERPHIDKSLKISEILHFFADFYDNFNSDRAIFLQNGRIVLNATVDEIRMSHGKSLDTLFREVFRC